jgi:regulator of protease activity HflC (stomatin/prohibitin superfamily)
MNSVKGIVFLVVVAFVSLLALFGIIGSWFIVDQGERAVVLRNGAFVRVAEPGLGFKLPIVDSVAKISLRDTKQVYDKLTSYSKDIQLAHLRVSAQVRVDSSKVSHVYEKFGGVEQAIDRVLTPRVADEIKVIFGQYNAQAAVTERGKLGADIEAALRKSINESGLILVSAQLEEIDFSKEFERSIEERMKAEVEVLKLRQNLEREKVQADIVRTKAQAQADSVLLNAKAEADSIKLKGDAEATAIKARANALQANAALIELTKAERWDGKLPTTMLPGGAVPMLSVGK